MFTGLIEGKGRVEAFLRRGADALLQVKAAFDLQDFRPGDSISVSGACLTATTAFGSIFEADVSAETLKKTTLGQFRSGREVNLERALRLGDRLGGHLLTGHVDGLGAVAFKRNVGGSIKFRFKIPPDLMRHVAPKGSVAVDGVSLTINEVGQDWFEVNIILHTAEKTTLALNKSGDMVNIETDLMAKYVERLIKPLKPGQGLSLEVLARQGFLNQEEV